MTNTRSSPNAGRLAFCALRNATVAQRQEAICFPLQRLALAARVDSAGRARTDARSEAAAAMNNKELNSDSRIKIC